MKNKAEEYNSSLMDEIFESISPKEEKRTKQKMLLAAKIEDAMNAKGWNKTRLLSEMGQMNASVATKWLSGTHNFTFDTLFDLQEILDIKLINTEDSQQEFVIKYHIVVQSNPVGHGDKDLGSIIPKRQYGKPTSFPSQIHSFYSKQTIAEA